METIIIAILGVVVIAAVAVPLLRGGRGGHHDAREYEVPRETPTSPAESAAGVSIRVDARAEPHGAPPVSDDALETEVARYRAAVAAGTVCPRCGEANAAEARFCGDCGRRLSASGEDAQEFA